MTEVARLGIGSTRKLLNAQGIDLDITDLALSQLAKEGYDPVYGARPLRRLIQNGIENPVASLLINKTFVQGDKILIDFDSQKEQFTFTKSSSQQNQTADKVTDQSKQDSDNQDHQDNQNHKAEIFGQYPNSVPQAPPPLPSQGVEEIQASV